MGEQWVIIHWSDITSIESPWMSKEEATELEPTEMWSSGVIIKDTPRCIVLAGTVDAQKESFGNLNAIPKGVIVNIRYLESGSLVEEDE